MADPWPKARSENVERFQAATAGVEGLEPMPGRPMREYVAVPAEVFADADATRGWIERAADYVRTLPPKESKPRKSRKRS